MSDIYYKPLPTFLEIKQSNVHGLGLFTKKNLPNDYVLGISHIKDEIGERHTIPAFFKDTSDDKLLPSDVLWNIFSHQQLASLVQ